MISNAKKTKAVQYFTEEYIEQCKSMTSLEIATFLDDFRLLHGPKPEMAKSKLISLKVPENLLSVFKRKAQLSGTPYQTQIKKLMRDWLES